MSSATKEAIEEAIRAHIADEADGPRVLTDWYVITASITDDDGENDYLHASSDSAWHVLWGLVAIAERRMANYDEDDG